MQKVNHTQIVIGGLPYYEVSDRVAIDYSSGSTLQYYINPYSFQDEKSEEFINWSLGKTGSISEYDSVLESEFISDELSHAEINTDTTMVKEHSANEVSNALNWVPKVTKNWVRTGSSMRRNASSLLPVPLIWSREGNLASSKKTECFTNSFCDFVQEQLPVDYSDEVTYLLKENSVEDGESHPVDNILSKILTQNKVLAWKWIQAFTYKNLKKDPILVADFLQCVSRLQDEYFDFNTLSLALMALNNSENEIRESGIRILESIGGELSVQILQDYNWV